MSKSKKKTRRTSVVVVPNRAGEVGIGEETEVAAQITVPIDGGWAWVILAASFVSVMIIDGVAYTYGAFIRDIATSLKCEMAVAALVNSIQTGAYYIMSPVASALINRFGFRIVMITGSIVSCIGLFASFYSNKIGSLIIFFGFITGTGDCLISMASLLIVGFYFEKKRGLAIAIATGGSSFGTMAMYPINSSLVKLSGWRYTLLLQAGLHGIIFFLGLTFRPLLTFTVIHTEEISGSPTPTVTYLPTLAADGTAVDTGVQPTATERMLNTVSSIHFPTAENFFHEGVPVGSQEAGTSADARASTLSRVTLLAHGPVSQKQLQQMQAMVAKSQTRRASITVEGKERKKMSCFKFYNCCDWEKHLPVTRPMYRDDAFYQGDVQNLSVYRKSVSAKNEDERTGLEYQLAVSRAIAVHDLQERERMCTTAVRRVLASMMDPSLLKRKSYLLFCISSLCAYSGMLVPMVFLQDRNEREGVEPTHCALFISVLSLAGLIGRFAINALALKIDPMYLYIITLILGGVSNIFSDLSYSLEYQYGYSVIFGICSSAPSGLRSLVLVSLYGLENLTNSTGINLMFVGLGNIYATPLAGCIKTKFGYTIAFYLSGIFMALGGVLAVPVKIIAKIEQKNKDIIKNTKY